MSSYTSVILEKLHLILLNEKQNNNKFKANAYQKAINNLQHISIYSIRDVENIPGIGKSIHTTIQSIIDTNIPSQCSITFTNIYGIGPVKSNQLINTHNIKSIEELRKNANLLNDKQKIGLKYYEDLLLKIPYSEMIMHSNKIYKSLENTDKESKFSIVGSFRRKKSESGDIDVLIVSNISMKTFVSNLSSYILETLALSDKKFMGICLNKRRIDMLITSPEEFPFAELYFTGSKEHNIMMRTKAKNMGYSLNEKKLIPLNDTIFKAPIMNNEKDIFDFLNIPYKNPENR